VKHLKKFLVLLCGIIAAVACQSTDPEKISDSEYIPLRKKVFQIYDVSSITYTDLNLPETLAYQLMTEVVDSFPNPEGDYTYVIHRSKRTDSTSATWTPVDTWSARINGQNAVISEGNIPYVKIAFPATNGRVWNGNALNAGDENDYKIMDAGKPFVTGGNTYSDCITIVQNNDDNLVNTDIRKEIYARHVGLVYVEKTQLNYCTDINCFGQKQIKDGLVYRQAIRSYGAK